MLRTSQKLFSQVIIAGALFVLVAGVPVSLTGINRAEAVTVHVASDSSGAGVITPIESALTTAENIAQTYFASADNFKEFVLDPLVWMLANTMISNMLTSLTQWVNSGFEGSPAFVTNIEQFLIDAADEAVGEFINGTELGFLCDAFSLDVRIALAIQYQAGKSFGAECSLSDIAGNVDDFLNGEFTQGGWPAWFELTQGPYNDPNRAYLEGKAYANSLAIQTSAREFDILEANEFFLNVKQCESVDTPSGTREVCNTGTPGNIVQDQVSDTLGVGRDRLTFADEFDELIGALLGQFANQAIMGVNGMLGMGGSGGNTDYSYGSSGNLSYLGALQEETFGETLNDSTDPIGDAIAQQQEYIAALQQLISVINNAEAELTAARRENGSCFNVRMPSRLTTMRDDAQDEIFLAQQRISLFLVYDNAYANATTPEERLDIMLDFNEIYVDIYADTLQKTRRAEIDTQYTIPPIISALRDDIESAERQCDRDSGSREGGGGAENN